MKTLAAVTVAMLGLYSATAGELSVEWEVAGQAEVLAQKERKMANFVQWMRTHYLPQDIQRKTRQRSLEIIVRPNLPRTGLFASGTTYLDASVIQSPEWERLLAHEYFHALHYWLNPGEEDWVREGMAQVFEALVIGRPNGRHLWAAQQFPSAPLVAKFDHRQKNVALYGQSLLYFSWLIRECGGKELFWDLLRPLKQLRGLDKIESALHQRASAKPQCQSAKQSVLDFHIAKVHNRVDFDNLDNPNRWFLGNYRFTKPEPLPARMVATSLYRLTPAQASHLLKTCGNCHIFSIPQGPLERPKLHTHSVQGTEALFGIWLP